MTLEHPNLSNYMFKVRNKNRLISRMCIKLMKKILKRPQNNVNCRSGVFIDNFEQLTH